MDGNAVFNIIPVCLECSIAPILLVCWCGRPLWFHPDVGWRLWNEFWLMQAYFCSHWRKKKPKTQQDLCSAVIQIHPNRVLPSIPSIIFKSPVRFFCFVFFCCQAQRCRISVNQISLVGNTAFCSAILTYFCSRKHSISCLSSLSWKFIVPKGNILLNSKMTRPVFILLKGFEKSLNETLYQFCQFISLFVCILDDVIMVTCGPKL